MDRLNHISLWWIVPALAAVGCLIDWARGRRT